jgi:hypothetical protein
MLFSFPVFIAVSIIAMAAMPTLIPMAMGTLL